MYLESHMAQPALMLCGVRSERAGTVGEEHFPPGRVGEPSPVGEACPVSP